MLQVNGGTLPPHVIPYCLAAAGFAALLPLVGLVVRWVGQCLECACLEVEPSRWQRTIYGVVTFVEWAMPSGIAIAVRLYLGGQIVLSLAFCFCHAPGGNIYVFTHLQVGMYVAPKWTLPRVLGSLAEQIWCRMAPHSHRALMILVASGLVLGEGTASIASAFVTAALQ